MTTRPAGAPFRCKHLTYGQLLSGQPAGAREQSIPLCRTAPRGASRWHLGARRSGGVPTLLCRRPKRGGLHGARTRSVLEHRASSGEA